MSRDKKKDQNLKEEKKRAGTEDSETERNRQSGVIRAHAGTRSLPGQRLATLASPAQNESTCQPTGISLTLQKSCGTTRELS